VSSIIESIGVLVIAGPTASGKTRLAVEAARRAGGEVICADSQQVYRGLDVGTAKPTAAERAEAPHHLLDLVEPGEPMDAAHWAALADRAVAEVAGRGRLPVVCGGTGLYLRALLHGVAEGPGRDPALRARLEEEAARLGRPALHARLAALDPEAARRIARNDLVRIVRALEMAAAGRTQSERFAAHRFAETRYRQRLVALDLPRPELHRRIDERVVRMFEGGMLAEAEALLARFRGALPRRLPIGYAEAAGLVRGELSRAEAVRRVQAAHRRYARRQLTWLRREPDLEWLRPPIDVAALAAAARHLIPG
jgi:tRNA dimethylallyltransferase